MSLLLDKMREYGADVDGAMERILNDEELYETCLTAFSQDTGFEALETSLKSQKYEEAFDAAHMLKGVAANLGLTPLFDVISEVVEPLRAGDYSSLEENYQKIQREHQRFSALLK